MDDEEKRKQLERLNKDIKYLLDELENHYEEIRELRFTISNLRAKKDTYERELV